MNDDLPLDAACRIGRHERRRLILHRLTDARPPLTVERLSRLVAAAELGCSPSTVSSADRERVHRSLRHHHLPLLVAARVVDYCPDSRRVTDWVDGPAAVLPRVAADALAARVASDGDPVDTAYDLLAHPTRRAVLWVLSRCDPPVTVEALSTRLDAVEGSRRAGPSRFGEDGDADARASEGGASDVDLFHRHLPKLADAGVIAFDGATVCDAWIDASIDWRDCSTVATADRGDERRRTGNDAGERVVDRGRTVTRPD